MKYVIQLITLLLFFASISSAQTIYVSDTVTEDNEPINANNQWEIEPWGKILHVVLDNENEKLEGNVVYLFIDKLNGNSYEPFDSKSINIQQNVRRINYEYNFSETGKYKLYYVNISQKILSSIIVTMKEKTKKRSKTVKRSNYYDNVEILFCQKVLVGGTPIGVTKRTSLRENNGEIYVKFVNFSPLRTEIILVDFWRKEHRTFEYDEYVESKKYRIDPDWKDTFFRYKFKKDGEYKIDIYNQEEVLITSGYINVLK